MKRSVCSRPRTAFRDLLGWNETLVEIGRYASGEAERSNVSTHGTVLKPLVAFKTLERSKPDAGFALGAAKRKPCASSDHKTARLP